ncbi:MAG: peptidylprolyl isomerase [Lachnospiraceae bacterium]|nr:peptidylprolyl isomerase [Lachnospiraceae bacterium]
MDKKRIAIIVSVVLGVAVLATAAFFGVRHLVGADAPKIVLTEGFSENEIFRINTLGCNLGEAKVYMRTSEDKYSRIFGNEIWSKDIGGTTLENELKSTTLARLAQIKAMNLLAISRGVTLTQEEEEMADKAADKYYSSLSDECKSSLGVSEELICKMYKEYAVANKVYLDVTRDINPEISDDEARTISVKQILLKTYSLDSNGEKHEFSDTDKQSVYQRAQQILEKVKNGEDFDSLVEQYNEDTQSLYTFGKGTMPEAFEEAAFNLDTDEVSDIVETEYGYHIIKCVSTFDREETDNNKTRILKQRKKEAFNQVYDEFVQTLHSNLNNELWDKVEFNSGDEDADAEGFFDVYNEIFKVEEE